MVERRRQVPRGGQVHKKKKPPDSTGVHFLNGEWILALSARMDDDASIVDSMLDMHRKLRCSYEVLFCAIEFYRRLPHEWRTCRSPRAVAYTCMLIASKMRDVFCAAPERARQLLCLQCSPAQLIQLETDVLAELSWRLDVVTLFDRAMRGEVQRASDGQTTSSTLHRQRCFEAAIAALTGKAHSACCAGEGAEALGTTSSAPCAET